MAYNNYYPATYFPQMPLQGTQTPQIGAQQSRQSITWVQGETDPKAYPVAPGGSVLLMDSEESRFYIKSADASGMPMPLRSFTYTEEVATQEHPNPEIDTSVFVTKEEFEAFKDSITPKKGEKCWETIYLTH